MRRPFPPPLFVFNLAVPGHRLTNDPFDFAVGVLNLRTGKFIGDLVYRALPAQICCSRSEH